MVPASARLLVARILALAALVLLPGASHARGAVNYAYDAFSIAAYSEPAAIGLGSVHDASSCAGCRHASAATSSLGKHDSVTECLAAEGGGLELSTAESWGNLKTLGTHFADHGADFGASSPDEYAAQASRFLQRSQGEGLPTKIDSFGTIRTYDPATNEFASFNANGTTRTYFAPDPASHGLPTNWDYWRSQPGAEPWTP